MRKIIFVAGIIAILMGLLWAAQGSGIFPYPATSPMISQTQWIWWGGLLALIGLGVAIYGSRK